MTQINITDVFRLWERQYDNINTQNWPNSTLYIIATPIGNLADLSLRAWFALNKVDVIAAEDTRTARVLLDAWGVTTPSISAHQHNEAEVTGKIVQRLSQGERVALISDAGAPGVSDPGGRIVNGVRAAGFQVIPIPGASAVVTALMASGMTSDEQPSFTFGGFLPHKSVARKRWLTDFLPLNHTLICYETPHRLCDSLRDLEDVLGAGHTLCIARELTKRFEEFQIGTISQLLTHFQAHPPKGEFVILVAPQSAQEVVDVKQHDELLLGLLNGNSLRDSVRIAMKYTGLSKDVVYERLLNLKNGEQA